MIDGLNLYGFVQGDPVNQVDFQGWLTIEPGEALQAAFDGAVADGTSAALGAGAQFGLSAGLGQLPDSTASTWILAVVAAVLGGLAFAYSLLGIARNATENAARRRWLQPLAVFLGLLLGGMLPIIGAAQGNRSQGIATLANFLGSFTRQFFQRVHAGGGASIGGRRSWRNTAIAAAIYAAPQYGITAVPGFWGTMGRAFVVEGIDAVGGAISRWIGGRFWVTHAPFNPGGRSPGTSRNPLAANHREELVAGGVTRNVGNTLTRIVDFALQQVNVGSSQAPIFRLAIVTTEFRGHFHDRVVRGMRWIFTQAAPPDIELGEPKPENAEPQAGSSAIFDPQQASPGSSRRGSASPSFNGHFQRALGNLSSTRL